MIKRSLLSLMLVLGATAALAADWPDLSGPYLGQTPPGNEPQLFAPGLVSTAWGDRDLVVGLEGTEIWFGLLDRVAVTLRLTRLVDGRWTEPAIPAFAADRGHPCLEPALSANGQRLYFLSTLPLPEEDDLPGWGNQNIFYVERQGEDWSEPRPASVSTTDEEYFPSLCNGGTIYFTHHRQGEPARIWRARSAGEGFDAAEQLPAQVNNGDDCYNAFVAPDESYLIVCIGGREDNLGPADYWICFRNERDEWSETVNLGPKINGPETRAGSAYVSPDGGYLFFSATRSDPAAFFPAGQLTEAGLRRLHESPANGASDIYWVAADFLQDLRPAGWTR